MGRPLNKKYFGNRNVGTTGAADNGIGGEGIAGVNFVDAGSWIATAGGAASPLAGLALPAPTIPGGVQATVQWFYGAEHVSTGAGSVGLVVGDVYTYAAYPGSRIVVATSTNNGTNATFTVTASGSSTTLPTDTQGVNLTKVTGTGVGTFLVDVFSHIVNAVIGEKGSGYTGAETFTVTNANSSTGNPPAGTIVLTTDSGAVGSATNQENAILMKARLPGGSATTVDIIRQVSTRRYKVTDGTRTGIVALKSSVATAAGEGSVRLVDSAGGTYFATKITAHKATIVRGTGTQAAFPTGACVKWNMIAATADSLLIDNA